MDFLQTFLLFHRIFMDIYFCIFKKCLQAHFQHLKEFLDIFAEFLVIYLHFQRISTYISFCIFTELLQTYLCMLPKNFYIYMFIHFHRISTSISSFVLFTEYLQTSSLLRNVDYALYWFSQEFPPSTTSIRQDRTPQSTRTFRTSQTAMLRIWQNLANIYEIQDSDILIY